MRRPPERARSPASRAHSGRSARRLAAIPIAAALLLAAILVRPPALPRPTGPHPPGRTIVRWSDAARPEPLTARLDDVRELVAVVWYPAHSHPGDRVGAPYVEDLHRLARDLRASGEVGAAAVFGLRFLRSSVRQDAPLSAVAERFPVLLLSPGSGTNVEFYAALAEDLASHGYVVVGMNHPYDVAAVALADGEVARFVAGSEERGSDFVAERIRVRAEDAVFALDRLERLDAVSDLFAGRLDLTRVGILGHSLGGITAAQACLLDARFGACLNLDGLQRGGAVSAESAAALPRQPFALITKEEVVREPLARQLAALPGGSVLVQIGGATHDSFTDVPLLASTLLPGPGAAERTLALVRFHVRTFFDRTLPAGTGPPAAGSADDRVSVTIHAPHEPGATLERETTCPFASGCR